MLEKSHSKPKPGLKKLFLGSLVFFINAGIAALSIWSVKSHHGKSDFNGEDFSAANEINGSFLERGAFITEEASQEAINNNAAASQKESPAIPKQAVTAPKTDDTAKKKSSSGSSSKSSSSKKSSGSSSKTKSS